MYTDEIVHDHRRDRTYLYHSKKCALCGLYFTEEMVKFIDVQKTDTPAGQCAVFGCNSTAWEGHTHEEDGQVYLICESHKNRLRTWKHHRMKGEQHKPIILHKGRLIDNPEYNLKQANKYANISRNTDGAKNAVHYTGDNEQ